MNWAAISESRKWHRFAHDVDPKVSVQPPSFSREKHGESGLPCLERERERFAVLPSAIFASIWNSWRNTVPLRFPNLLLCKWSFSSREKHAGKTRNLFRPQLSRPLANEPNEQIYNQRKNCPDEFLSPLLERKTSRSPLNHGIDLLRSFTTVRNPFSPRANFRRKVAESVRFSQFCFGNSNSRVY